jgi:hypothetical protein
MRIELELWGVVDPCNQTLDSTQLRGWDDRLGCEVWVHQDGSLLALHSQVWVTKGLMDPWIQTHGLRDTIALEVEAGKALRR